jgi:hypothetical protein
MHNGEASMQFTDTSPRAQARYLELLRAMPPQKRFRRAIELSALVRKLTLADVRRQNPGATERELAIALARRVYGDELADRLATRR